MKPRIVGYDALRSRLEQRLDHVNVQDFDLVTGPGRSGAIASALTSHITGLPFLPCGVFVDGARVLVVDTARASGKTVRKCMKKYGSSGCVIAFEEPPRVKFWYEGPGETSL